MTTIVATRDRMVCDSKVTHGDTAYHGLKVFRIKGALVGTAGDTSELGQFIEWFKKGAKPGSAPKIENPSFDVLVLDKSGLRIYSGSFHADPVTDQHYAIGTGAYAALAAIHCGKTPEEAVEIACRIDVNSGPPVQTHMLAVARAPRKGGSNG